MSENLRQIYSLLTLALVILLLTILASCSTPPPTLTPPTASKLLEISVTLSSDLQVSVSTDDRRYIGAVIASFNLDQRPISINLYTWDEIFCFVGNFFRFHRVRSPDASPDPESQWSYPISMPDSFKVPKKVVFRLSLPDDLIGEPSSYRIIVMTKVFPDIFPGKVDEEFTYYPVDTIGVDLTAPEYIDFSPSIGYSFKNDDEGDYSVPFPELPDTFYRGLDITSVEVRILTP